MSGSEQAPWSDGCDSCQAPSCGDTTEPCTRRDLRVATPELYARTRGHRHPPGECLRAPRRRLAGYRERAAGPSWKNRRMASPITPPRGMRDFLPAEKARREHALGVIRRAFAAHGFDEIETPVVEDVERLHSGLGGDNEKLSFSILKRGLDGDDLAAAIDSGDLLDLADLGLRFDLTVPLARFYASHRAELPEVFRAIQIAPVWRAERPQKGRYRQFVQCDIDIIGDASARAEAELIVATLDTLDALGLEGGSVRINDRRALDAMLDVFGFAPSERPGVLITIDKLDKVGPSGVVAELRERGATASAVDAL